MIQLLLERCDDMLIRKIKEEELEKALELVWKVFLEYESPDYSDEGILEFKKSINDQEFINKLELYGAFHKNELLGIIATRNTTHIALLFVDGKYHKQGIAKALYKYVSDKNEQGIFTVNSSPYAKKVYEKFGFEATDSEQTVNGMKFYPMKNNNVVNYKTALNKFLAEYRKEDTYLGSILTGSYATGNNNQNSDIDVYIILNNDVTWRERGNKLVDGYMIEYFVNPKRRVLSYFEDELKTYHISSTMMFVNGQIIEDKNNEVEELITLAKNNIKNLDSFGELSDFKYNSNCYSVWDGFDELEVKYNDNEDIDLSYYIFIQRVIDGYFYNKKIPSLPLNKLEKIFKDETYRNKYNILKLPKQEFIDLILKCLNEKDYHKKYNCAKDLYEFFKNECNDFDINNYALRSSAE